LGLTPLPALVPIDPDVADTFSELHETTAWVLTALIAAHVAAALWHHFMRRDGVLASMWPTRHLADRLAHPSPRTPNHNSETPAP
jgi:cytochrome b561